MNRSLELRMASGRILHFSVEDLHRADILRGAGHTVLECKSVLELIHTLRTDRAFDLICISEAGKPEEGPLAIANAYSPAPVVLFRSTYNTYLQPGWKMEIAPLTKPESWLRAIEALLTDPGGPVVQS